MRASVKVKHELLILKLVSGWGSLEHKFGVMWEKGACAAAGILQLCDETWTGWIRAWEVWCQLVEVVSWIVVGWLLGRGRGGDWGVAACGEGF